MQPDSQPDALLQNAPNASAEDLSPRGRCCAACGPARASDGTVARGAHRERTDRGDSGSWIAAMV